MSIQNSWNALKSLKKSRKLEPYINHIRFPYYKNLEPNFRLDFNFPLTALVGQNGTNKSSVLRALYGCPEGYNVGNFWFSTDVDPISSEGSGGRPRFIYGYFQGEAKQDIEVIKTRIQRSYAKQKGKTGDKKDNPDYWEPSRPLVSDGMKGMPKDMDMKGRLKTRWKLIDKNVIFMDFRSEISAFDKYFYHGDLKVTLTHNSKQDYIRSKSHLIKTAVEKDLSSKKMYRGRKEQIISNVVLCDEQKEYISNVLGRKYSDIRILEHRFFRHAGHTVILKSSGLEYSEAFAGSGEFSVVMLVNKIFNAPRKSLIILDEPEVSLHPSAQVSLINFLIDRIKTEHHQIVIGTHSPFILELLPPEAIKTLYLSPSSQRVQSTSETLPEEAFFHLGVKGKSKRTIFVEDRLAAEIIRKALRVLGQAIYESFEVKAPPGGASALLLNHLPYTALSDREDTIFIMDGDQKPDEPVDFDQEWQHQTIEVLESTTRKLLGGKYKPNIDGGNGGAREDQARSAYVKIILFCKRYLSFLPNQTPEEFVWGSIDQAKIDIDFDFEAIQCYKEKFRLLAQFELGKEEYEPVTSDEIFNVQKRYLAKIDAVELESLMGDITSFCRDT